MFCATLSLIPMNELFNFIYHYEPKLEDKVKNWKHGVRYNFETEDTVPVQPNEVFVILVIETIPRLLLTKYKFINR